MTWSETFWCEQTYYSYACGLGVNVHYELIYRKNLEIACRSVQHDRTQHKRPRNWEMYFHYWSLFVMGVHLLQYPVIYTQTFIKHYAIYISLNLLQPAFREPRSWWRSLSHLLSAALIQLIDGEGCQYFTRSNRWTKSVESTLLC